MPVRNLPILVPEQLYKARTRGAFRLRTDGFQLGRLVTVVVVA
jgi:hypothetical protein